MDEQKEVIELHALQLEKRSIMVNIQHLMTGKQINV